MKTSISKQLATALFVAAALGGFSAASTAAEHSKVADGIAMYLGVMPSEIIRGQPQGEEAGMHGGMPAGGQYHHVVVALFDSKSGKRITGAEVKAKVEQPGHLQFSEKRLEPMTINKTVSYGNFFAMPGPGPYQIFLTVRMPGSAKAVEAQFEYIHPQ